MSTAYFSCFNTCLAASDLASPTRARQASILMESASVMGVLMWSNSSSAMIPLLDRTQSHSLFMRSSDPLAVAFFRAEPPTFALAPAPGVGVVERTTGEDEVEAREAHPGRETGAQTQLMIRFSADRRTSADSFEQGKKNMKLDSSYRKITEEKISRNLDGVHSFSRHVALAHC